MIFKALWTQQTQLFYRQTGLLTGLLLLILISTFSLYSGRTVIRQQQRHIDSLENLYRADEQKIRATLADTLSISGKAQAARAGMPENINYRLPQNAVNPASGLAVLSIGTREVSPYYDRVKTSVSFLNPVNGTIFNPLLLFIGKLDFAFVLLYLLPLLAIIFCYDARSSEQEQGTLPLLLAQGISETQLLIGKLSFRLAVLWFTYLILQLIAFAVAYSVAPFAWQEAVAWTLLFSGWLFFWFALSYATLSLNLPSRSNAIALVSCWILLLYLLPNLLNSWVNAQYPIPLRADIASYERHQSEEIWGMKPTDLVDSFHYYNPTYAPGFIAARDTLRLSRRSVAGYYDLLARRLAQKRQELQKEIAQRAQAAEAYGQWVPALFVQHCANQLAQSDLDSKHNFEEAVAKFQLQWRDFLYQFQLNERPLRATDFERFPVFVAPARKTQLPPSDLLYPWLLSLILLILSLCLKQKH